MAIEAHIAIIGERDNDKGVGCLQSYGGELFSQIFYFCFLGGK